ncbi:MAG: Rieske 2Fe-2S domain-containing protein [bacterium]|nr:Rieske 2Fe-2S domain-containing protein [bacterium]MDE0240147.1 Rieske 2Fe-2S domain-containing protein [bacterium]
MLTHDTGALVEKLSSLAKRDLADAATMPGEVYASRKFFDLELERIFAREWHCAGRAESIPQPGDYLTWRIGAQPVAVVRQKDGSLKALSNVCRHRMMKLLSGSGRCRRIVCPYHAWTYDLDGSLLEARHMDRTRGFDVSAISLPRVRCEVWQGWIYVTLDADIPTPKERLAGLERVIADYHAADYVEVDRQDHVWKTNWKLLTENFMEGYHLPVTHRRTVGAYFPVEETCFGDDEAAFTHQWFSKTPDAPVGTAHPQNRRLEGRARSTSVLGTVFPCHMFVLAPDHLWYLSLQPRNPGEIDVRYGLAFAPEVMADQEVYDARFEEAKAFLDATNEEDRVVVEALWEGVQAPLAEPGPLSWLEKENLDFLRYILRMVTA